MRIVEKAYTFDDVLLVPAHSNVLPRDVKLQTKLTRDITLNLPLLLLQWIPLPKHVWPFLWLKKAVSALSIKNMTPELQARAVSKVKRHESGVVKDPVTVAPTALIREVLEMRAQRKRKMSGLPVVENGKVSVL